VFGFAVKFNFRSPRARVLVFLVIGSGIVVIATWHSLSWHARGIILAVYGLAFLGAMLILALRTRGLLQSGAQAQGTVVGAERDTRYDNSGHRVTTYNLVVRFTTADGRTVEFTSAVGTSRSPDIGGAVPVRYRLDHPEQAEIDRATMWILPAAFGLVGGLGLLVAAVFVYSSPVSSPVNGTPRYWAAGAKVVPAPSGFTLSQSPYVPNGPMSAADFNNYWGDPASLHFARGYNVAYDSTDASASVCHCFRFPSHGSIARTQTSET